MKRGPGPCTLLLLSLGLSLAGCEKMEARSLIKEGNNLYRAGQMEQALARYQGANKLDPHFPTLQLHLGYTHMALASMSQDPVARRHSDAAATAFKALMRLNPGDERGPRFYLQVLLDAGRTEEALAFLRAQHKEKPNDIKTVSSLGVVSSRAGKFEEALGWYEKRARMLPGEAKARYLIGTLCWQRLHKNEAVAGKARIQLADRGIRALAEALQLDPGYAEALTYSNLLYRERAKGQDDPAAQEADMEQARSYYQQAMKLIKSREAGGR